MAVILNDVKDLGRDSSPVAQNDTPSLPYSRLPLLA